MATTSWCSGLWRTALRTSNVPSSPRHSTGSDRAGVLVRCLHETIQSNQSKKPPSAAGLSNAPAAAALAPCSRAGACGAPRCRAGRVRPRRDAAHPWPAGEGGSCMPLAHHTAKNQRGSGPPRLRPFPTQWRAAAAQLLAARRCACGRATAPPLLQQQLPDQHAAAAAPASTSSQRAGSCACHGAPAARARCTRCQAAPQRARARCPPESTRLSAPAPAARWPPGAC